MIIWNGYGFLVFVFVFVSSLIANFITILLTTGETYYDEHQWPFAISLIFSAIVCWFVGKHLDKQKTRVLIDKKTGEQLIDIPNHAFFFIKMHWWAPILLIFSVVIFIKELL